MAWRNVVSQPQRTTFAVGEDEHPVDWYGGRDGYRSTDPAVHVLSASPDEVVLEVGGVSVRYAVARRADTSPAHRPVRRHLSRSTADLCPRVCEKCPRFVDPADVVAQGSLLAPMPGTVIGVPLEDGAEVTAGQTVLVLEAMKMQHTIKAPTDGVVSDLVAVGQQVAAGDVLAVVAAPDDSRETRRRDGMSSFTESEERQTLRKEVAKLAKSYGREYFTRCARNGEKTTDLWLAIGKAGYLGINIPEQYGGGGGGIGDVAAVCEELAAQGCPLLMMVVSPAICGTVISRYGTEAQKQKWLPGICDGTETMAFAITEPDAGTNSHNITTTARRDLPDGDDVAAQGSEDLHLRRRRGQERAGRLPHGGREDRQAQAVPVRRARPTRPA